MFLLSKIPFLLSLYLVAQWSEHLLDMWKMRYVVLLVAENSSLVSEECVLTTSSLEVFFAWRLNKTNFSI